MRPTRLLSFAGLLAALALFAPSLASADSPTSLTVVGTSDVSDSGLIQNVIQPAFHAAYPQFTFKYIGVATGVAIDDAESGSVGASAMIVHAASLENQFVAGGYSYKNQYGNAIFTNDFVLAGPPSDPAGVAANGAHNITQAFADVATAGIAGKAEFVSRGGTPGTTVEEHEVWALLAASGAQPAGLTLCAVSAADGGGDTPINPTTGVGNGAACPNGGALPAGSALPSWYTTTNLTQGPNVVAANACTAFTNKGCYVLTDRGTYDYLSSGSDPAGAIPNLTIVTRGPQSATTPGGTYALTNFFHAYVINPSKVGDVNLTAAQDFVNLLTSPALQARLSTYLNTFPYAGAIQDPGGAPFVADASPTITESGFPTTTVKGGSKVTVSGSVINNEPGYPAISGQPVTIDTLEGTVPVPVASGTTTTTGTYSITFTPTATGYYQVTTGDISQVENSKLSPVFGDILSPGASAVVHLAVQTGTPNVSFKKVKIKKGKLTVTGKLSIPQATAGGKIELLALRLSKTGTTKTIREDLLEAHAAAEKRAGKTSIGAGKTKFTIKTKLKRGYSYVLQLEFVKKGETSSYSRVKTVTVS